MAKGSGKPKMMNKVMAPKGKGKPKDKGMPAFMMANKSAKVSAKKDK